MNEDITPWPSDVLLWGLFWFFALFTKPKGNWRHALYKTVTLK